MRGIVSRVGYTVIPLRCVCCQLNEKIKCALDLQSWPS